MLPCGGQPLRSAATQAVTTLVPGSTYTLRFEETINHPGCFLVDFSPAGEANWQPLATVKHVGTMPNPSERAPRPYSQVVTMPNVTCTDCTLRVRQVMMESRGGETAACPPASLADVPTYFSCANIVLAGSPVPAPAAAPAPAATPAPTAAPAPAGAQGPVDNTGLGCSTALGSQKSRLGLASSLLLIALIARRSRSRRRRD